MSTVYIGNAVGDEHGQASGGEAGNQNGKELRTQPWYLNKKGWIVLRPKDSAVASKLAYDMKAACNNTHIGYDQKQRNTLFDAASKVDYDCSKVTTACECDCSSLVRVCLWYAGIKVKNFNTASEADVLMKTGKFEKLTGAKYTEQSAYLKTGDILITAMKGHTAIVLNDGDKAEKKTEAVPIPEPIPSPKPTPTPAPKPPISTDPYVMVLGSVRVRKTAPNGVTLMIAHKFDMLPYLGETVTLYDGAKWYYVSTEKGNGYISAFTNQKRKYTKLVNA